MHTHSRGDRRAGERAHDVSRPPAIGLAAQKKSLHASERDTARVQQARADYRERIAPIDGHKGFQRMLDYEVDLVTPFDRLTKALAAEFLATAVAPGRATRCKLTARVIPARRVSSRG
jgi:hypothetical protein